MKSYGQFCPVAKACEILAERWTPLVLRELLSGSTRFSQLQRGVPLMSRTLLARRLRELEDAELLAWDMHRRLDVDRLPPRRVVVRFDLRGVPRRQVGRAAWWLILDRPEVDLCLKDPGHEVDLTVEADLLALTRVWMGDMPLRDALRRGVIRPEGPRELVRAFPSWFGLSLFAGVERPAAAARPATGRPGSSARPSSAA